MLLIIIAKGFACLAGLGFFALTSHLSIAALRQREFTFAGFIAVLACLEAAITALAFHLAWDA